MIQILYWNRPVAGFVTKVKNLELQKLKFREHLSNCSFSKWAFILAASFVVPVQEDCASIFVYAQ
jgi:hypothetical protein